MPVVIIEPNGTSSICPGCGSKLRENGYSAEMQKLWLQSNRDTIAVLNIEKIALLKMGDL